MRKDRLLAHYDEKYAGEYNDEIVRPTSLPSNRHEAAIHYFPSLFHGGAVLELAAGSGHLARSLLAAGLPCESYTLSEVSEKRLRGASSTIDDPRVRIRRLDAEDLPDDVDRYDAVLMLALIEHLIDPITTMTRVRGLLKPGGFVYVDTPNVAKWTRRLKLLAGQFPSTASVDEGLMTYDGKPVDLFDEGHLQYFTFRSLTRLLTTRCGYSRVVRLPYWVDRYLPRPIGHRLGLAWPTLFSELCVAAYA